MINLSAERNFMESSRKDKGLMRRINAANSILQRKFSFVNLYGLSSLCCMNFVTIGQHQFSEQNNFNTGKISPTKCHNPGKHDVFSQYWIEHQGNLALLTYSPNLNLMERLWKFFNEKVRCNKYFEKFSDFVLAAKGFFRCRTKFKEELRSRLRKTSKCFDKLKWTMV